MSGRTPPPWSEFCSLERLHELHDQALVRYGGAEGVRDPGCPEGTLGNAWTACSYAEIGESLPQVVYAVYVLYYFVTKQCFTDGNKRIGWLAMVEVLASLDLEVTATDDEAITFVLDLANRRRTIEDALKWVMARLVVIDRTRRAPPQIPLALVSPATE